MPSALVGIQRWTPPQGSWYGLDAVRRGRWLMFGHSRSATAFIDLDRWTPKAVANRTEYAVSFDVLPDGRFVACSMRTAPESEYAIRIHPAGWPADPDTGAGAAEVYPGPGGLTLARPCAIGERVVVFGWLLQRNNSAEAHLAYLLEGREWVPAPGLNPVTAFAPDRFGLQLHANGKVELASGPSVLVWAGDGYEWIDGAFEKRWELGARANNFDWSAVPWGTDGFFYLSDRRVMLARRGQTPVAVLPDAENVLSLAPGPETSILLCQGRNPKSFVARVWFPLEGAYIPLQRSHFGWGQASAGPGQLHWNAAHQHIHFMPLATVPDAEVLALKRVRPRGDGYQVPLA